jgi:hypothetical protein
VAKVFEISVFTIAILCVLCGEIIF